MQKEKNTLTNSYDFLGIRYAHFQKATLDLRYYQSLLKESKMVYRLFSGIGIPRNNFKEALPFEKSFFAGGSNSLRAWRARSIGPGIYFEEDGNFDKIGGFGGIFDLKNCGYEDPLLVSGTDGIGTKILLGIETDILDCLLYTSPSPRDRTRSRMPSSA